MVECRKCKVATNVAQFILYQGKVYKSCPECSKAAHEHCYYIVPDDFGVTEKRITNANPIGIQSYCNSCRGGLKGPYEDALTCSFLLKNGGVVIEDTHNLTDLLNKSDVDYEITLPEEIETSVSEVLKEGQKTSITVNAYERNPQARKRCIEYYRLLNHGKIKCEICGFDFSKTYGAEFDGKIHIHHIKEIASIGEEYLIDAEHDLLPVCPNCHMVAHSKVPAYTPEEIKAMLQNNEH